MSKMWIRMSLMSIMVEVCLVTAKTRHEIYVDHQEANSFLHTARYKRGFFNSLFGGEEHRERAKQRMEEATEMVRMQTEIKCRQKCWDTWTAWGQCSGKCSTGSRTRTRVVRKDLKECKPYPCHGSDVETHACHIDCGPGGLPKNGACICRPGYYADCCSKRVICRRPPTPAHGSLLGVQDHPVLYYDMVVTYTCEEGYAMVGPEQRRCKIDGAFDGKNTICRRIECPSPKVPEHGKLLNVETPYLYGASVGYKCDIGYDLKGVDTRKCILGKEGRGRWSAFDPTCQERQCGDPGTPRHGTKTGTDFSYEGVVSFSCERGFTQIGSETRECRASGRWDGNQPVCKEVLCEMLERPVNGLVTTKETSVDAVLEFSCEKGYEMVGSRVLLCRENGTWNGTAPVCQEIDCGDPGKPKNGEREDNGFRLDQEVLFSCHGGYVLTGPKSTKCLKDGTWTNPVPTCEACKINQYKEGPGDGGRCVACPPNSHTVTPASSSRQQCLCDKGFRGKPGGPCSEIGCEALSAPAHGSISPCGRNMGDSCEFDCAEGYIFIRGSSIRTCNEFGQWDGSPPVCKACPVDTYKADAGSCLPCPEHAHTKQTGSSRNQCVCDAGYTGSPGGPCTDLDECKANGGLGDCEQACVNYDGGYRCECTNFGYIINPEDGHTCIPEQSCRNLTQEDAPAHGGLVCHWYKEENSQQCTVKCDAGYEFPARTNQYETCGPVTGYIWTYKAADEDATIYPCVEEIFPGFQFEAKSAYFSKACRDLTDADKEEVKREFANTLTKEGVCQNRKTKLCDFRNVGIICGTVRRRRGTEEVEEDVVEIKLDIAARKVVEKAINCDHLCPRLRIPASRCPDLCTEIYKRHLRAGTMYARRQLDQLFQKNHSALAFRAANRHFEAADLRTTKVHADCKPGMKSENGMCVPCLRGSMLFRKYNECVRCPRGSYQGTDFQEECLPCPPGQTSHTGATSCYDCPEGTYGFDCELKCACVHGKCDPATGRCVCSSGWEGALCDRDIPGCRADSCFAGVTCTDVKAPGSGHTCGACPAGRTGNGLTCTQTAHK